MLTHSVSRCIADFNESTVMQKMIILLISFFLITATTVNHAGSLTFLVLFFLGLTSLTTWKILDKSEKYFLLGLALFFICVLLSLVNTENIESGTKKLGKYMIFILSIPVYLLIRKHKVNYGQYIVPILIVSVIVMAVQAFYQINILEMERAKGAYNPLILGAVAMTKAVILIAAVLTLDYTVKQKAGLVIFVLLALYVSAVAGGRGIMLFVPLYALWLFVHYRKSLSLKAFVSISVALVIGASLLLSTDVMQSRIKRGIDQYNNFISNPEQNPDKTDSIGLRANLWKDSVTIWTANPILGTGIGDFLKDSQALYKAGKSNADHELTHAHSVYFNTLATTGMFGVVALLVFVFWLPLNMFRKMNKNEDDTYLSFYSLVGMSVILAYAEYGFFESLFSRNSFILTFLVFLIIFLTSIFNNTKNNNA